MYSIPIRLLEYPEEVMPNNVLSSKFLSKCFSYNTDLERIIILAIAKPPADIVSIVVI